MVDTASQILRPMLLDIRNRFAIADQLALGAAIEQSGKEHLWDDRPAGSVVDTVVVHHISALHVAGASPYDLNAVLKIFVDFGVSSHFLILRSGEILSLVPEANRAWHAGASQMPPPDNRRSVNQFSIGIELMATPDGGYTAAQYLSLAGLGRDIATRHPITSWVGHDEIAGDRAVQEGIRTEPKRDPGALFSWNILAAAARTLSFEIQHPCR